MQILRAVVIAHLVLGGSAILPGRAADTLTIDLQDTATRYLSAWAFKDYPTMYRLSSPDVRNGMSEQAFYAAAAAVPAPAADPKVVKRSAGDDGGETLYIEYTVSGSEAPTRSSLQVLPGGVKHADLLSHAPAPPQVASTTAAGAQGSGAGTGSQSGIGLLQVPTRNETSPASQTIDGETVETVLTKMQKATEAAETLQADLEMKGSMMGQTINETGKLVYRAPNNIRLQSTRFVLNGKDGKTTLYLPQMNAYMDIGALGDFELAPGIGTPVSELREKYSIALVGKSEVDGVPAYQLSLRPPSSGSGGGGIGAIMGGIGGGTMRIWVSTQNWLPIRAKVDTVTADYRNMRINAGGVSDNDFMFVPPAGATELNLGSMLGGLGGGMSGAGLPTE